jgi:hypothetical protein
MAIRDQQIGGDHYKKHAIQPWDVIDCYRLNYYEGNVLKYLLRRKESRIEDLRKAAHYIEKAIEMERQISDSLGSPLSRSCCVSGAVVERPVNAGRRSDCG